ncbi:unnamed protein product [Paramecium octaurelia]|uniref:Uncharacterized protein n=1 Tax=Paramecium octaurelia TaxID=43137 RepID=A0A8S1W584_PAROT|nr:unnamed protein product [Paramecium octaurelia]
MSIKIQKCFIVKNTPVVPGKQVYIHILGSGQNKFHQMEKNNEFYQVQLDINQRGFYQYKYLVADNNEQKKQEKGYRNFYYGKQNLQMVDSWNKKEVTLRIYTKQQSIFDGLKIKVHQKFNSEVKIKQSEIELRQIKQNKRIYYEGIIFAESDLNILEIEFFFNAVGQNPSRLDQKYMKSIEFYYTNLKTVGNQSYVEINEEEFEKLSCKPIVNETNQQKLNNLQNLSENYTFSKELQYDKIQTLMQIFETSIKNYSEKLQSKDNQIKELYLEKLQHDDFIIYNYKDAFEPDVISEYQNEFYLIVKDLQNKNNSIFTQFNQDFYSQEQMIQEYKTQILENEKTIDLLIKKINSEKDIKKQNVKQIEKLKDEIKKYQQHLDQKKTAVGKLEEYSNEEKQIKQVTIIEKEKQFRQQIEVLDNEIQEFKRNNESLKNDHKTISKEKENLMRLTNEKDEQLYIIKRENRKLTENQEESKKELEEAQQTLNKQNDSLGIITAILKEIIFLLVNLCKNILKVLTSINDQNEQKTFNMDIVNLKIHLSLIEQGLQDYLEQKKTLQQVEVYFYQEVQPLLRYMCNSVRIKQGKQMEISNSQFYMIQIFKVLKKFESIQEIMPMPKPILSRQTTEVSLKQIRSPYYHKLGIKENLYSKD